MIAAAAAAKTTIKIMDERHQRRSKTVRVFLSYFCRTLKAFMYNDFIIRFSRKYQMDFC